MPERSKPARALKLWESLQPLVQLYNLHIDFNYCCEVSPPRPPKDTDRKKLIEYLRQHAPHIFLREVNPARTYGTVPGTLPYFQELKGQNWFLTEHCAAFCCFCADLCSLLRSYADQNLTVSRLMTLARLLQEFKPTFMLRNRATGEFYSIGAHWSAPLDTKRYELVWGGGIVETGEVLSKYQIAVGDLLARLTFALYRIIADGVRVIRCQRRGCLDVFIPKPRAPTGDKAPKYCPRCRSRRKK